jgi:hypothetical protein
MRHRHRENADTKMKLLCAILLGCAIVHAGPLPACGGQFDYSCASPTPGGFTVITPLTGIGSTEITGFNSSNAVVFDQTIPIPPSGPAGADVQLSVLNADAQLALQSGQENTLPACTLSSTTICVLTSPPDGVFTSNAFTYSYVAMDTPLTQQVNQYSTTLIATLNGSHVFSETFGAPFSNPTVQAAVLLADALLNGDGATFGSPFLASGSTSLAGSQLSYLQTGEQNTGTVQETTTELFGPNFIIGCTVAAENCLDFGDQLFPALMFIQPGQLDINLRTNIEVAIDRNVVTTNTFLTTQTYEIDGTNETSAVPEPATWGLMLTGALAIGIEKIWRSR